MATSSLAVKSLTVTLTTALIALVATQDEPKLALLVAGVLPVIVFWFLNAKYLHLELCFRKLYEDGRKGDVADEFSMDIERYKKVVPTVFRTAVSWSVIWFYLIAIIALGGAHSII